MIIITGYVVTFDKCATIEIFCVRRLSDELVVNLALVTCTVLSKFFILK
jgi:hypothetical protein